MLLITMAFVIPANAASTRAISVEPDIDFVGTRATCSVLIVGDRTTDEIEANSMHPVHRGEKRDFAK